MKKYYIIFIMTLICLSSCKMSEKQRILLEPENFSAQDFFDKGIKHNIIKDSAGHTLILHEYSKRGTRFYSFSIEHSPECKKCCEIYD